MVMLSEAECADARLPLRAGQAVKTDLGLVSIALLLLLLTAHCPWLTLLLCSPILVHRSSFLEPSRSTQRAWRSSRAASSSRPSRSLPT